MRKLAVGVLETLLSLGAILSEHGWRCVAALCQKRTLINASTGATPVIRTANDTPPGLRRSPAEFLGWRRSFLHAAPWACWSSLSDLRSNLS